MKGSAFMYKKYQPTYKMLRVDPATWEWLHKHPNADADIRFCRSCGCYYMPSLGHTCKGGVNDV